MGARGQHFLLLLVAAGFIVDAFGANPFDFQTDAQAVQESKNWNALLEKAEGSDPVKAAAAKNKLRALYVKWTNFAAKSGLMEERAYKGPGRYQNWLASLKNVININLSEPKPQYYVELNLFSAMGREEKRSYFFAAPSVTARRAEQARAAPVEYKPKTVELPARVDWRERNVVNRPGFQGSCGACYVFSGLGAYEANFLIVNNLTRADYKLALSTQQVVACGNPNGKYYGQSGGGCNGGLENLVLRYMAEEGGVVQASAYPFKAAKARIMAENGTYADFVEFETYECRAGIVSHTPKKWETQFHTEEEPGYSKVPARSKQALMEAVALMGPVTIPYRVEDGFIDFAKGIYDTKSITCTQPDPTYGYVLLNHAMVVVGYDTTGPIPYWIVKNSFGTWAGDGGYWNIRMYEDGDGLCGMYSESYHPIIKAGELPPLA